MTTNRLYGIMASVFVPLFAGVVVMFVVTACSSTPAQAEDPNHTSEKVADNGSYGTYIDKHVIDGQTVPCVVISANAKLAVSCDWSGKWNR